MSLDKMARRVAGARKSGLVILVVDYSDAYGVEAALKAAFDAQKAALSAKGISVSEIHCEKLYDAEEE